MKCPLRGGAKVGEHGPYVVLLEDGDGAGPRKYRESLQRAKGEKDQGTAGSRKMARTTGLWKRRGVEKSKSDFPTPLGNPANPAGFPLSHSLGDCGRLTKTGHSICYEKRTFLMS